MANPKISMGGGEKPTHPPPLIGPPRPRPPLSIPPREKPLPPLSPPPLPRKPPLSIPRPPRPPRPTDKWRMSERESCHEIHATVNWRKKNQLPYKNLLL